MSDYETRLPPIQRKRMTGDENFIYNNEEQKIRLLDFWQWAFSDLVDNTLRGELAEFIVAKALNIKLDMRTSWDPYDLTLDNGLKIEVKASSYIQSWYQKRYSNITFGIPETEAYDGNTNTYEKANKRRQADIYIFCLLHHKIQDTLNPLELSQWTFYVLTSKLLNEKKKSNKSISLNEIIKLGAKPITFNMLKESIDGMK